MHGDLGEHRICGCTAPAATTLICGMIGFLCGFLLSLVVSAYSLYACIEVL